MASGYMDEVLDESLTTNNNQDENKKLRAYAYTSTGLSLALVAGMAYVGGEQLFKNYHLSTMAAGFTATSAIICLGDMFNKKANSSGAILAMVSVYATGCLGINTYISYNYYKEKQASLKITNEFARQLRSLEYTPELELLNNDTYVVTDKDFAPAP